MAQNGIIFFESGEVQIFGKLQTVRGIATAIQETMPSLIAQEREQLLNTVTEDELKKLIDSKAKPKLEDNDDI